MRILALDFETSGLTPGVHAPVSLGVAVMEDEQVIDGREWLFAPPTNRKGRISREYSVAALEVSATTWPRIKREGLPAKTIARELRAFAEDYSVTEAAVVSFNAAFDLAWYADVLFLAGGWRNGKYQPARPPLIGAWHCAYMRARAQLELDGYTLDHVATHLGMARAGSAHGAREDAILAGRVWTALSGALAMS